MILDDEAKEKIRELYGTEKTGNRKIKKSYATIGKMFGVSNAAIAHVINGRKGFEPFPVRQLRASNKNWEALKKKKNESGKTWDKFIEELLNLTQHIIK